MKKVMALSLLLVSVGSQAAQCRIDIKNQVRLDGQNIEIAQENGDKAVVNSDNSLTIHGEKIELNDDQQAAIAAYREQMNDYLPRAKKVADDSLALANDIIDDLAQSLDAPGSFDNVKTALKEFYADVESRYYKDGDLVLPAQSLSEMTSSWSEDFQKAKELFNTEFLSDAMGVLSEKMKKDGGWNLTELSDSMYELKAKIEQRMAEHAKKAEQQAQDFCESLDDMAEQEQQLMEKIPELKDYQVFTI